MAEVKLILTADNSQYITKMKEAQTVTQKLHDTSVSGGKREKGILEEIDATLVRLQKAKQKAFTYEDIEKYNKKIQEAKLNLQEYEQAGLKVEKSGNSMLTSLKSWALGFATVSLAVEGFKKIIQSTDSLSDKFEATLNGWKEGFASMARAIANNDFENFFKNVKSAVQEGQRYSEMEDKIGDSARAMKIRIAENETALKKLREVQNDASKSNKETLKSGLEAERIVKANAEDRLKLAQMIYDNEIKNAAEISKQDEATVKRFLQQEPMLMRQIEIGLKYNELIKERNKISLDTGGGILGPDLQAALANQIKIDALGTEAAAYGELAIGLNNIIDVQKEKIASDLEGIEVAKQSAINLRVSSRVDAMIAKDLKGSSKEKLDVIKQFFEDWERETEIDIKKRTELNKKATDKEKADIESEWQFGLKQGKLLFAQNQKQAKDNWGLMLDNEEKIKKEEDEASKAKIEAFKLAADTVMKLMDDIYANNVADAQRRRELLDTQIAEIQNEVETEVALYQSGHAANIESKKNELAELKKQRDEALKKEEAAVKAQKAFDTISQMSSLITASANIYKSLSKLGPVGIGISIATIATMFGAFLAAKAQASKVAGFAKGGWTGEGSERDSTGERVAGVVHEREFVIKKGPAHRFKDVLEAINRDDRKMIFNSFNKLSPEIGAVVNNVVVENSGSNSRLDKLIQENKKLNARLSNESIMDLGNVQIVRKGSTIRTIRK